MKIERIKESRFSPEIFKDLVFGNTFGDHMLVAEFRDGQWGEAKIMPYGPISFSPAMQGLHYGQAIFEGMKCYKGLDDEIYLFRPEKNFERINKSAVRMNMPEIPKEIFMNGLNTLLDMDRAWVPPHYGMSLYVRPVLFASEPMVTARSSNEFTFILLTCPAPDYYSKALSVKIAQEYSRAAKGGVGFAKAAGNYGASFYPTQLAKNEGYDQVIWTDSLTHEYIEEAGTMNVFVRIGDELLTAPTSERILNGVTRNSVLQIAKDKGFNVNERRIAVAEMHEAHKNGDLKEVFGCGTAVVLNNFSAVGYPQEHLELPLLEPSESFGQQIKKTLMDIQFAREADKFGWRHKIQRKTVAV